MSVQPATAILAVEGPALEDCNRARRNSPSAAATAVVATTVAKARGARGDRGKREKSPPPDGFREARTRTGSKALAESRASDDTRAESRASEEAVKNEPLDVPIVASKACCLLYGCSCCRSTTVTFCACFSPGSGPTSATPRCWCDASCVGRNRRKEYHSGGA
jgi:hypothetical protein